jgi:hypothetical protein
MVKPATTLMTANPTAMPISLKMGEIPVVIIDISLHDLLD